MIANWFHCVNTVTFCLGNSPFQCRINSKTFDNLAVGSISSLPLSSRLSQSAASAGEGLKFTASLPFRVSFFFDFVFDTFFLIGFMTTWHLLSLSGSKASPHSEQRLTYTTYDVNIIGFVILLETLPLHHPLFPLLFPPWCTFHRRYVHILEWLGDLPLWDDHTSDIASCFGV